MERVTESAFAACLEQRRPGFNARFAQARSLTPSLDGEALLVHLREIVAPVVEAVAASQPDRVDAVADALFELSLQLLARDMVGAQSRQFELWPLWQRVMIGLPGLLGQSPRRLGGAVFNALYNLSQSPGANRAAWCGGALEIAVASPDIAAFMAAGKAVAWRCGLPEQRLKALDICRQLDPTVARAALGLVVNSVPLEAILDQLRADPWLKPESAGHNAVKQLQLVATVGAFRGFGGAFVSPPTVSFAEGQFWVADNQNCWVLCADVFGATLHRWGTAAQMPPASADASFIISGAGRVTKVGSEAEFPQLAGARSFASDGTTLAVTVPLSHSVYLVAEISNA